MSEISEREENAYTAGFYDALATYSWMKGGVTYVGTCGDTLKKAQNNVTKLYNYNPRVME